MQLFYVTHWRIFPLENVFYKSVVPLVNEMVERRSKNPELLRLPVPEYIAGGEEFLALHDLRPEGFKMADKYAGMDFAQVKLFMEHLGRFHATTYAFIRERGERYFEEEDHRLLLGKICVPPFHPHLQDMMLQNFVVIYDRAVEILERRNPALAGKMRKYCGNVGKIITRLSARTDVKYFPVISHGDIWVNNLIIKTKTTYENGKATEVPTDLKLLDFQQARRDNIFWDLLYFMFTSTTPEFRQKHLISVLMIYYENFVKALELLNCPLPIDFTRGWLIDQYFENIPTAYAYMPFAIPLQLGDFSCLGLQSPKPVPPDMIEDKPSSWDRFAGHAESLAITLMEHTEVVQERLEAVTKEVDELRIFDRIF